MFSGVVGMLGDPMDPTGLDPYTETYPGTSPSPSPSPIGTGCDPNIDLFCTGGSYVPGGGGYQSGGGSTITPTGTSADPFLNFSKGFGPIAAGIANIASAFQGKSYATPWGSSGVAANPYGAGALGVTGGISTTTLLLIVAAAFFLLRK